MLIARCRARTSGSLQDRIDLHVDVPGVKFSGVARAAGGEPSAAVAVRVAAAREIQRVRYAASARDGI